MFKPVSPFRGEIRVPSTFLDGGRCDGGDGVAGRRGKAEGHVAVHRDVVAVREAAVEEGGRNAPYQPGQSVHPNGEAWGFGREGAVR